MWVGSFPLGTSGVYLRDINTDVKDSESKLPNNFQLSQNYPNPFNPSTTIQYDIPKYSHVKIIVIDVLGQQVEILVDEEKPVGTYKVNFNGSALPSGVYFYVLTSENFRETKKMILLR